MRLFELFESAKTPEQKRALLYLSQRLVDLDFSTPRLIKARHESGSYSGGSFQWYDERYIAQRESKQNPKLVDVISIIFFSDDWIEIELDGKPLLDMHRYRGGFTFEKLIDDYMTVLEQRLGS